MSEPRKIVLILGNGFDLDLGLKTSYKDFWESEFCPKDYPAPLIRHLNTRWSNSRDAVKWYDLENELLSYAIHGDKSDVVSIHERNYIQSNSDYTLQNRISYYGGDDMMSSLVEKGYMKIDKDFVYKVTIPHKEDYSQTSNWRDRKALRLIKDGLCKYLSALQLPRNASSTIAFQVLAFLDEEARKASLVNVYTFNYTRVQLNGKAPDYAQVHYLHGKCDDGKVIIGTRDDQNLNENYDFFQKSFDPAFNPPALVEDLKDADEVVIFGHSIGENDRQYFKAFFKQQTDYSHPNRKDITIFTLNDHSEIQIKRALEMMTDWNLSTLYGLNNLQIIKTGNIEEDQRLLYDFLVKHGKEDFRTREFIGKLLHNKTEK